MFRFKMAFAVSALLTAPMLARPAQNPSPAPGHELVIQMTASKYKFNPFVINARQGKPVKLMVKALDHSYGFKLKAFHVDQKLEKGETTTIEFTPDKAGTFTYECGLFCGLGHRMTGKIVVQ